MRDVVHFCASTLKKLFTESGNEERDLHGENVRQRKFKMCYVYEEELFDFWKC